MTVLPRNGAFFLLVATGVFLSTMDSSMVNIALPFITRSFSTTLGASEWVVLSYLLTITVFLLVFGQLSDRYGKGVFYSIGMLVFSVGCLCCYFSSTLTLLIFSRFIQGLGAAMMMSAGPAIIRLVVPKQNLGSWLGALGVATSLGLMSGPLFGGYVIYNFSWRMMFLLTVPVSLSVCCLGWLFLAGTLPKYYDASRKFDWYGSILWAIVVFLVTVLLNGNLLETITWKVTAVISCFIFLYIFLLHELKQDDPLIPIGLLRQKYYVIAMLSVTLSFAVLFFVLILMPFYLSYVKECTSKEIGYIMMAVPVSLFVVSPLSGRLFDHFGAKYLTSFGLFLSGCAILLLASIQVEDSAYKICGVLAMIGCGQSIFLTPNSASVLARVRSEETGTSSGMLATCRNLGMLIGVALTGLIFSAIFHFFSNGQNLKNYSVELLVPFIHSYRASLCIVALLAFIGALISLKRE